MQAIFYNFTKKANSTARPTNGTAFDIVFKYPSSIHSPVLQIKATAFNYNYCYIGQFETYYRVTETRTIAQGLWEVSLEHDLLATYKTELLENSAYINYASLNFNPLLLDTRCAMYTPRFNKSDGVSLPYMTSYGSYVITVLAQTTNASRFTNTYLIDEENLGKLVNYMMDTDLQWSDILKIVNNPIESIIRIAWIPFTLTETSSRIKTPLRIGNQTISTVLGFHLLPDSSLNLMNGESLALIPWEYDDFRRYEPYSKLTAWLPMQGAIPLNVSQFVDADNIIIKHSIDLFTGDITLSFGEESGDYRQTINYNASVEIPVAQLFTNVQGIMSDITSVTSGILSTAGAGLSGNAIGVAGGIAHSGFSALNLALDSQTPSKSIKGSIQGMSLARYPMQIILFCTYFETESPVAYTSYRGRPISKYDALSNYSGGFVQANVSLSIANALPSEVERLNSMLAEGIYLE